MHHSRGVLAALVAALALALSLPAAALAQEDQPQGDVGGGNSQTETGGGGFAATGFEAWQLGLVGLVLIGGALVVLRRPKRVRN